MKFGLPHKKVVTHLLPSKKEKYESLRNVTILHIFDDSINKGVVLDGDGTCVHIVARLLI